MSVIVSLGFELFGQNKQFEEVILDGRKFLPGISAEISHII